VSGLDGKRLTAECQTRATELWCDAPRNNVAVF
jgi:hypothetical protein